MITQEEVLELQKIWGDGITSIGNTFNDQGDYVSEAKKFISNLYSYIFISLLVPVRQ